MKRLTLVRMRLVNGELLVESWDIVELSEIEDEMFGDVLASKGYEKLPVP